MPASGSGKLEHVIELGPSGSAAFAFEGAAGSVFGVSIDGAADGAFVVSDPTGVILEVDDNLGGREEGSVELVVDGPHFLLALSFSDEPATYAIRSTVPVAPLEEPEDGLQLEVGTFTAGLIDYYGDTDAYSIQLNESDTIILYTEAIATDTLIAILPRGASDEGGMFDDDSGPSLFGDSLNAELVYTAPVTGVYDIGVTDPSGAAGGSYFLGVDVAE